LFERRHAVRVATLGDDVERPPKKSGGLSIPASANRQEIERAGPAEAGLYGRENRMAKRMIVMLTVTLLFVAALGFVKFQQIQTAIAEGAAFQPPPEAVTTIVAAEEQWPATFSAIGTAAAVQGVTVSADLPGTVERIQFESGQAVSAGAVLAVLDTRQEQAQLAAIEAQHEHARLTFERMEGLLNERVISRAEFDRATAEYRQADARAGEIRAVIARKTIRAPFSGILGLRQVNLGQYLAGGDPLVTLQSLNPIYVNFGVPQQAVRQIPVGRTVRIAAADGAAGRRTEWTARVTALDSLVDEATRNIQVQATLANPDGTLRPGMFVQTEVVLGPSQRVVALPASAISYAPYGDSVFVVAEMKGEDGKPYRGVRQQFVKVGPARGDQVAVLSGVKPGDEVVTSGLFKLRNGAAVQINNSVRPSNSPAPAPENS
jgi:membrane fusion protein (multidrug efflux system)